MKKYITRRNKNKKQQTRDAPSYQLSRRLDVMKTAATSLNLLVPATIYGKNTSGQYSFSTGSDTRYFTFSQILASAAPFAQFVNVYSEYKITGASVAISPYSGIASSSVQACPMLYLSVDPQSSSGNPTNATITGNQTSHLFTTVQTNVRSVAFSFSGIGSNMNLWLDTSVTPQGAFFIGSIGGTYTTNPIVFDCSFSLKVVFRTTKSN